MRNVEKYLLMRDLPFRHECENNKADFNDAITKIGHIIDSEGEKKLVSEIEFFHEIYERETDLTNFGAKGSQTARASLSEGIIQRANDLIRLRDQAASNRMALAERPRGICGRGDVLADGIRNRRRLCNGLHARTRNQPPP